LFYHVSKLLSILCFYLVLVLTCFIYHQGLYGPLILDDIPNLYPLHRYSDGFINLNEAFSALVHSKDHSIAMMSFIGNWLLTGDSIWHLKYTNLMIHILCGTLIYWISGRLLNNRLTIKDANNWYTALWIASL